MLRDFFQKRRGELIIGILIALVSSALWFFFTQTFEYREKKKEAFSVEMVPKLESLEVSDTIINDKSKVRILYSDNTFSPEYQSEYQNQKDFYLGCILLVHFTNTSKNDIRLTEISIAADNIVVDEAPVFVYNLSLSDNSITIEIINNGWGIAENPYVVLSADELIGLIGSEAKTVSADNLAAGASNLQGLLSFSEMNTSNLQEDEKIVFTPSATINYDNIDKPFELDFPEITVSKKGLEWNNDLKGMGDGTVSYGIVVNTNNKSFKNSFPTNQIIPAGETVLLPICIAPDKSCSMDFELSIQFNLKSKKNDAINTKFKNVTFFVPYYKDDNISDGSKLASNDIETAEERYFPFMTISSVLGPASRLDD